MILTNSRQANAVALLMIEKGLITEEEFYSKLKEVQDEYEKKRKGKIE